MELTSEFKKSNLKLLALTEIKKKGTGEMIVEDCTIMYSGVESSIWAQAGVGCIVKNDFMSRIKRWEGVNERIMVVEVRFDEDEFWTVIIVYGPNENDNKNSKDKFWDELQEVYEKSSSPILIVVDLNGRVGNEARNSNGVIGSFGETIKNKNGELLIDFCNSNGLIILNTWFQHKEIHKFTRVAPARNEKSIIDYIITEKNLRNKIHDVKVGRLPELGSDHFLVVAKINLKEANISKDTMKATSKEKRTVRTHKLANEEIRSNFTKLTEEKFKRMGVQQQTLEQRWKFFKDTIYDAARKVCGFTRTGGSKKRTSWWSEETKLVIKEKKKLWKAYLANSTRQSYEMYKEGRIKI
ncbi:craniofacial development protein 2-like [Zophobas morio]|uniref:craniofacial development protein 2-like n=1 Tax=Zophobas morio TaxID=2755281 RepID=UPI003082AE9D